MGRSPWAEERGINLFDKPIKNESAKATQLPAGEVSAVIVSVSEESGQETPSGIIRARLAARLGLSVVTLGLLYKTVEVAQRAAIRSEGDFGVGLQNGAFVEPILWGTAMVVAAGGTIFSFKRS